MKMLFKKITAVAMALAIATSLSVCSFAAYKGDVNADGKVNSADALVVLKYTIKKINEIDTKAADMDDNGIINSTDALKILRVTVELDEKIEIPEEEEPVDPYEAMIALKETYPEGTPWDNSNYYGWNGGIYSGGYGCAGFAFMLSDAAFGNAPTTQIDNVTIDKVRVGDILRINNNTHSVIVLEVHEDHVIIAEGNYNSSVHWGRKLTASEVAASTYMMTRYDTLPA